MSSESHAPPTPSPVLRVALVMALLALGGLTWTSLPLRTGSSYECFAPSVNYGVGSNPRSVAVGDFNGDGKLDLAVANAGSGTVSVLLGNGNGTFQPAVSYGVGSGSVSVAVGDLNGDGKLDLAVANGGGTVSVLLGNGNGTFQAAVSYGAGSSSFSVAVGDLNGDGRPDLAVANYSSNTVSVLLGNGNGTFQAAVSYLVGSNPYSVAVGDFFEDGRPDLAVAKSSRVGNVSVLVNAGCREPRATVFALTSTAIVGTATAAALTATPNAATATAAARTATAISGTATAFALTSTPPPRATSTPYPRQNVDVQVAPDSPGRLRVTLTARDAGCVANNQLFELRFGAMTNGQVDLGDGTLHGSGFLYPLPTPARQVTFYVVRQTPGEASTVPLTAVDGCGAWPTFVGGGPTAF